MAAPSDSDLNLLFTAALEFGLNSARGVAAAARRAEGPVPSQDVVRGSDLAGWAEYGYCASHSRYFWGLRLHLIATLHGLPSPSP